MSKKRLLIFLMAVFAGASVTLCADGANVEVQLKDGRTLSGELYAVRDSAILLRSEERAAPDDFRTAIPGYCHIETRLIKHVIVGHGSTVLQSMGMGALVGGGVGVILGAASGNDPKGSFLRFSAGEKAALAGVALGATGLVIGLVVGIVQSSNERVVEPLEGWDLSVLRPVSRYPDGEPPSLKNIP